MTSMTELVIEAVNELVDVQEVEGVVHRLVLEVDVEVR